MNYIITLEIRFRKLSLTDVKSTCPLFRQKGLLLKERIKNLEALITSQLECRSLATLDDLEKVIFDETEDVSNSDMCSSDMIKGCVVTNSGGNGITTSNGIKIDDFILVLFEDGAYPGQVLDIIEDRNEIRLNFMAPIILQREKKFQFWQWPSYPEELVINNSSILPIKPFLELCERSTKRHPIFELKNFDVVKKFT